MEGRLLDAIAKEAGYDVQVMPWAGYDVQAIHGMRRLGICKADAVGCRMKHVTTLGRPACDARLPAHLVRPCRSCR